MAKQPDGAMRNGAYRAFQVQVDNLIEGKLTGVLPECIVDWVKEMFPSPVGVDHGWPWDAKELIALGHEPSEYIAKQDIEFKERVQFLEAKRMNDELKKQDEGDDGSEG